MWIAGSGINFGDIAIVTSLDGWPGVIRRLGLCCQFFCTGSQHLSVKVVEVES